jgi:hypothetical protein
MSKTVGINHPHFQIDVIPANIYPIAKKLISGQTIEADFVLDIIFNINHKSPTNIKGLSIKLLMSNQKHFPFNDSASKNLNVYTNDKPLQYNINLKITLNSLIDKVIGIRSNNTNNIRYLDDGNRMTIYYKLEASYLGHFLGKKYMSNLGTFEVSE